MRHLHFYLFGFAALVAACQPVTPTTVNSKAAPTITVAPEGQTEIDLVVSTVTKTADNEAGTALDLSLALAPITAPKTQESPPFRQRRQFSQRQFSLNVQPPFRPKAMIGSASIILTSRSWHCHYDPAGRPD